MLLEIIKSPKIRIKSYYEVIQEFTFLGHRDGEV